MTITLTSVTREQPVTIRNREEYIVISFFYMIIYFCDITITLYIKFKPKIKYYQPKISFTNP